MQQITERQNPADCKKAGPLLWVFSMLHYDELFFSVSLKKRNLLTLLICILK